MKTGLATFVLSGVLLGAAPAHAALDDVLSAKASDVQAVKVGNVSLRMRQRGALKEFAGSDGKVFAASWTGRVDLHELLGTHYAAYEAAVAQQHLGHHVLAIHTPELTAMRIVYGRYLTGSVALTQSTPKGITLNALR